MTTRSETAETSSLLEGQGIARRGGIAAVVAVLVNVALVSLTNVLEIAPYLEPLTRGPVVVATTIGILGATLVYAVLVQFLENPDRPFLVLSVVVLLASLVPDVLYVPGLVGATTAGVAVLAFMHVTTAIVAVVVLTDLVPLPDLPQF